jgi:hypothetical protein
MTIWEMSAELTNDPASPPGGLKTELLRWLSEEGRFAPDIGRLLEALCEKLTALSIPIARVTGLSWRIQRADGSSGLEAVNELLQSSHIRHRLSSLPPIPSFLTGERPGPAFLISKPFQPAMVSAIASQALFFEHKAKRPVAQLYA